MLGTVLGVGCFVAVLGLTATAAGQIAQDFSTQLATAVQVNDAGADSTSDRVRSFTDDAEQRLARLNGVDSSGVAWSVSVNPTITGPLGGSGTNQIQVMAASSGYLDAALPIWASGRVYTQFQQEHRLAVVVLGQATAQRLGVSEAGETIFLDGTPHLVTGILKDVATRPELLASVLLPASTALERFGDPTSLSPASMLIRTDLGAAQQVASEAARQLRPDDPSLLAVVPPPDPPRMASVISTSMQALFTALAGVTLLIGGAAIANTTLVSVMERTQEIGLRRALGANPGDIVTQFLLETVILGALSGLVGASLGLITVIIVAVSQHWTALIDSWVVFASPGIGAGVGLIAGLYPAWRAGHINPIQALRH
ncbi:MAG: ABC transporter permease [Propionibacteriaceae bacterium]|nr:ABC transporter permease [Propionibacteriaceae bacterium]